MDNLPEHIDELIAKVLAGEATSREKSTLAAWLDAGDENKRYFRSLEILFHTAAVAKQRPDFDTDSAWNALRERIRKSSPEPTRKIAATRSASWYLKVAATLLAIITVGYLVLRRGEENPVRMTAQSGLTTRQDTLPDGSTAWLNISTTLEYAFEPGEGSRRLKLEGEAYFEVSHAEDSPFIIESAEVFIEDIGTAFNIKAYPESSAVEVFVESGEVAFYTESDSGLRLVAGETGRYDRHARTFSRIASPDENVLAYKTRKFNFTDADLPSIIRSLNGVYPTKIRLGNEKLAGCRLNVAFEDESIEAIADIIAETLGLSVTRQNGEIILEGTGCEQ